MMSAVYLHSNLKKRLILNNTLFDILIPQKTKKLYLLLEKVDIILQDETPVEVISTNLSIKKFCRIPMDEEVPYITVLIKHTNKYG